MRQLLPLLLLIALAPAWASEPGQPLDASDWVILDPRLTIETVLEYPCKIEGTNQPEPGCGIAGAGNVLVEGDILFHRKVQLTFNDECGCSENLFRIDIVRIKPDGTQRRIAYVKYRCNLAEAEFTDRISVTGLWFDPVRGRISVLTNMTGVNLQDDGPGLCTTTQAYPSGYSKFQIGGLRSLVGLFGN